MKQAKNRRNVDVVKEIRLRVLYLMQSFTDNTIGTDELKMLFKVFSCFI